MIVFMIFSCLVDYLFSYFLPFLPPIFFYFKPCLFPSTLIIYMIFYHKQEQKKNLLITAVLLYDLFSYSANFLYPLVFYLIYFWITFLSSKVHLYFWNYLFLYLSSFILFLFLEDFFLFPNLSSLSYFGGSLVSFLLPNTLFSIILYLFLRIKCKNA